MNVKIIPPEIGLAISIITSILVAATIFMLFALIILKQSILVPITIVLSATALFFAKRPFVR